MIGWIKNLFRNEYQDKASFLTAEAVLGELLSRLNDKGAVQVELADTRYMLMETRRLHDLVYQCRDDRFLAYRKDFPDCDDFALVMRAWVVIGAATRFFAAAPLFGEISYQRRGGGWHAANWALDADLNVWLYEPQTGEWDSSLVDVVQIGRMRV